MFGYFHHKLYIKKLLKLWNWDNELFTFINSRCS